MIPALLMSCALATSSPDLASAPSTADREAYQAAKSKAGRDPEANVRLALWCEAHGLEAERLKHLSLAALADPAQATARALMGLVSEGGRWGRPEAVAARIKADPAVSAIRAEYEARRNKTDATADDQWALARWCEKNGLGAEATAHDTAVTRLDPSREPAWKKLGYKKIDGRWMTPEQAESVRANREAQALADKRWLPRLERWKDWIDGHHRQAEAEAGLLGVVDPRAVPSIWKVFATKSPRDQARAVRLLGQVDSTDASRALAAIAVYGGSDDVRRQAVETLRGRDVRGALDDVIKLLREPIKYLAKPNQGPDSPGVILIEGEKANLERIYPLDVANDLRSPRAQLRLPQILQTATEQANLRFADDVRSLEVTNATIKATSTNALSTLKGVTGKEFGLDKGAWMAWWTDRQGYAFKEPATTTSAEKPTLTQILQPYATHHSCFAAGTSVQTIDGPRPIEGLKAGDRILTQDTTTGVLGYQPALAVFHNPPAETLRVRIGGENVVATGIHRFWKAGIGWTMARDLKPGDAIRRLGGTARVESVEPDKRQPVFNLEVARGNDFFVGQGGALVHDNSLVQPVAKPFDATPDLAVGLSSR